MISPGCSCVEEGQTEEEEQSSTSKELLSHPMDVRGAQLLCYVLLKLTARRPLVPTESVQTPETLKLQFKLETMLENKLNKNLKTLTKSSYLCITYSKQIKLSDI
ncbi:hypothetical protein FQN60_013145 [Etheostoma spectabile]|uniref:Uncharacterized protein n=1 Tax=Etheostoma spectabile TaxID=54343 RepID=A0A5J5DAB1_9PERO|nr:hypothetical protein FQN60_013145 [Etheostoma spectabile]